jgi:ADP-ribosyl-[dinitrogen reductase] hydrolase
MHEETMMDQVLQDRIRGIAVGAAVGDALGMPLEFGPRQPADRLVRDMKPGRLPSGTFTDDTEMALALAESLLDYHPLDPNDLVNRYREWFGTGPDDVGIHTRDVLSRVELGQSWQRAVEAVQRQKPELAGNGSLMRCWPVAIAHWNDLAWLVTDSRQQSRVTHGHPECEAASAFVNAVIYHLLRGTPPELAVDRSLLLVEMPEALRAIIQAAPTRGREQLRNTGWVRHTVESVVWGLLTTQSFEDALVQVVNLGDDTDTAGAVVGAMAGAAYGLAAIPDRWSQAVRGEWPVRNGTIWRAADLIILADRLAGL